MNSELFFLGTLLVHFILGKEPMIIIITKELPQQAALQGTISLGGQEKRKDRKRRGRRSEEKVVGFSSASLFFTRGGSHPGWNH